MVVELVYAPAHEVGRWIIGGDLASYFDTVIAAMEANHPHVARQNMLYFE